MSKIYIGSVLFSLILVGGGCSGSASVGEAQPIAAPQASAPAQRYEHSQYGFSLALPNGWTAKEDDPSFPLLLNSNRSESVSSKMNYRTHVTVDGGKFDGTALEALRSFFKSSSNDWAKATILDESSVSEGEMDVATMRVKMVGNINNEPLTVLTTCKAYLGVDKIAYIVCGYGWELAWANDQTVVEYVVSSFKP